MYVLEDDVYEETEKIKLGRLDQSPLLKDLSDWFAQRFKVKVLNFRFDTIRISKRNRFRLSIIVDNKNDYEKMVPDELQNNEIIENLVAVEFKSLTQKHGFPIDKRVKNIFIVFYDFSIEVMTKANERVVEGFRKQIKAEHPSVWEIYEAFDSLVVFYYLGNQVEENRRNGISETIRDSYYEAVKQFDEMNYFTRKNIEITFDSKENLDKNFEGNFYYYIH
jgi:hypothetical protein